MTRPTRYEPQALAPRVTDPYEEWRAKREAERERSRVEAVRWVYRQRAAAAAPNNREDAAAGAVRWVNRYRGVGRAAHRARDVRREREPDDGRGRPVDLVGAQGG